MQASVFLLVTLPIWLIPAILAAILRLAWFGVEVGFGFVIKMLDL